MSTASSQTSLTAMHRLCWTALMAALISAGALFHIAVGPVPITFQDLFVTLAGLALGPRYGVYAMILYIVAGCAGLPVFSGGRAGLGHAVGPTGGYLAGFVLLAFFAGLGSRAALRLTGRKSDAGGTLSLGLAPISAAIAMALLGLMLVYALGSAWLAWTMDFTSAQAFAAGVLPFLPLGIPKIILCVLLWRMLYVRRLLPQ